MKGDSGPLDYEYLVFVPEILRARNSVDFMQIRERNEVGAASPLAARRLLLDETRKRKENARKRKRLLAVYRSVGVLRQTFGKVEDQV